MKNVRQTNDKGVLKMKLNNQNYMAYGYGTVTIETLLRFYNEYGIACECCGDDKGYVIRAEQLKEAK